jgi:hypothetical protein
MLAAVKSRLRTMRAFRFPGIVKPIGTRRYLTRKIRKPRLRSRDERAPLDQCGRASLFVNLAGREMTLPVEMIVDLSLN